MMKCLQNEHKAAQARTAKVAAKGVTTAAKSQASSASAMENIRAFMEDDNPVKDGYGSSIGKPLVGGKAVDSGTILGAFQNYENQIINSDADEDTKAQKLMKLYTYSGVSNVKEQLVNNVLQTINSATADSVAANGVPNSIIYLVKARNSNHGQFAGAFGRSSWGAHCSCMACACTRYAHKPGISCSRVKCCCGGTISFY